MTFFMPSPMLSRIADGRTDLVFDYLAQGHAADACDAGGVSLVQWCVYHGDVSALRFLLSQGATLASLGENLDLNGAVFHGHWQLSEFLMEQGADVNQPLPGTGEAPLHSALCKNNPAVYNPIIKLLLARGADPNHATNVGMETGSFMRDCRTRGETPLHRAAAYGDAETIQLLLDAGARLDAKDAQGDSPLTWASWHLRSRTILKLLCYDKFSVQG